MNIPIPLLAEVIKPNLFSSFYFIPFKIKVSILTFFILFISQTLAFPAQAQELTLRGKVINASSGLPLSSVTIQVAGFSKGATSQENGEFMLTGISALPVSLVIRHLGFEEQTIQVNSSQYITIQLQEEVNVLSEVVVSSGYNVQRKSEFSGAVALVNAKQLENRPSVSFDQLLSGQAAGVDILQPTGVLNNSPIMRIRGLNTITSGLFPLVVVDGVTMFVGSIGGLIGNNPLADINPNDIESIDVLKDASASAIYGSRAANGVMVITTKKGKGKPKLSYDTWMSLSTPYNLPPLLNAQDYTMIKNEAMVNAGREPGFALMENPDGSIVNTNWYDVAYRTGVSHNHNISLSGANEATSYFFSAGYSNQNSFIRFNTYERGVARLNIDHKLNNFLKVGANLMGSKSLNTGPNTGAISGNSMSSSSYNTNYITNEPLGRMTYVLPPNVPVFRPDGSFSIQNGNSVGYGANIPSLVGTINAYNLEAVLQLDKNSSENNTLLGNIFAEVNLLENLKFRTSYGLNQLLVENKFFLNPLNGGGASANGTATNTNTKYLRTDFVNTLIYNFNLQDAHHFNVLLGIERIKTTVDGWGAQQSNVADPSYNMYQGVFGNISPTGNIYSENALLSYFSSINYDFNKKYLLSFTFRRDGLSALAAGKKYGNFGSGSIGWNISEEAFYKESALSQVINNIKLRGSYGIVGNSEIGDYPAIGTYNSYTYGGLPVLSYSQAANPNLRWEKSTKLDIGLNLSFLESRINLDFDYYKNVVDGLILKEPQSLSAGIPNNYINANVGSLYNEGVELGINAVIINGNDFRWNASVNVATLKNKVTSLSSDVFVPSIFGVHNMTREGYSIGSIFAVPCLGVNPDNGLMMFVNSEGNTVQYNHVGSPRWTYLDGSPAPAIDNYKDGKIQGPSLPKVFGGVNQTLTYKNFDLNLNFTFVGGNKLYNGTRATNSDQRYFNNGTFIKDRWTTPGQKTEIQKLYYGDNVSAGFSFSSTSKVEDGSYLKLRNISLGYHIPLDNKFLQGKIASAYVFVQSGNVFTLTKYRGSDPEVSINGNSIHSGKDQNVPPTARVFTAGLNIGF